jgi:hypothetical protein
LILLLLLLLLLFLTGLGLFVEGEVPPGALVALFPGLAYSKDVHRWGCA